MPPRFARALVALSFVAALPLTLAAGGRSAAPVLVSVTVQRSCVVGSGTGLSLACSPSSESTRVQTMMDGQSPTTTTLSAGSGAQRAQLPLEPSVASGSAVPRTVTVLF